MKTCKRCEQTKPLSEFRQGRHQCKKCRLEVAKLNARNKRAGYKDREYITLDNAMRVTGLKRVSLQRHVSLGHIRAIKVPGKTNEKMRYHIDDCRVLSWPGTWDIAEVAGIDGNSLSKQIGRFDIPSARRIGKKWRFPPQTADTIVKWARMGYPSPFRGIYRRVE